MQSSCRAHTNTNDLPNERTRARQTALRSRRYPRRARAKVSTRSASQSPQQIRFVKTSGRTESFRAFYGQAHPFTRTDKRRLLRRSVSRLLKVFRTTRIHRAHRVVVFDDRSMQKQRANRKPRRLFVFRQDFLQIVFLGGKKELIVVSEPLSLERATLFIYPASFRAATL